MPTTTLSSFATPKSKPAIKACLADALTWTSRRAATSKPPRSRDYLQRKTFDAHLRQPDEARAANARALLTNGAPRPVVHARSARGGFWRLDRADVSRRCRNASAPARPRGCDQLAAGTIPNAEKCGDLSRPHRTVRAGDSATPRRPAVAVFCHGGVIRQMLAILLDLPLPKTAGFEIDYTSITEVDIHPHRARGSVAQLSRRGAI